jgi:hypothetical protein
MTKQDLDNFAQEIKKHCLMNPESDIKKLSEQFINEFVTYVQCNKIKSKEFDKLREDYFYDGIGHDFIGSIVEMDKFEDFGYFSCVNLTKKMLSKDLASFEISTVVYLILDLESFNTLIGNIEAKIVKDVCSRAINTFGPTSISKEIDEYVKTFGYVVDDFILPSMCKD